MKVVVLAGGFSGEREVSLASGCRIANALSDRGHEVLLLDPYLGIPDLPKDPSVLFRKSGFDSYRVPESLPDLDALRRQTGNGNALIGKNVPEICRMADRVFPALHGGAGEDGRLQALLDCYGIGYAGSGALGSMLAMNKDIAKQIFRASGIPTPEWVCIRAGEVTAAEILTRLKLPCVVKPTDGGSSIGVVFAYTSDELEDAIRKESGRGRLLVEEKIDGREFTVGILDGTVLPAVEILPREGFYDFGNKYRGTTKEICPADIPERVRRKMAEYVQKGFDALHLGGYARFDFLMDVCEKTWCLEANTLPGMTSASLFPTEAEAMGIGYGDLCEIMMGTAEKREF